MSIRKNPLRTDRRGSVSSSGRTAVRTYFFIIGQSAQSPSAGALTPVAAGVVLAASVIFFIMMRCSAKWTWTALMTSGSFDVILRAAPSLVF
jgi:hypothetical protein